MDFNVFQKHFEQAYNELVSREDFSLDTMAEKFREVYDTLMLAEIDSYVKGWMLTQAPITLIPPVNDPSVLAFAGNDGRIYINPVFINALLSFIQDEVVKFDDSDKVFRLMADTLGYIISHEMSHILLKHVWTGKAVIQSVSQTSGIPEQILHLISNITMDYVVNTNICNDLYTSVVENKILFFGIADNNSFYRSLTNLLGQALDFEGLKKRLEQIDNVEGLQNKTWDELFYEILKFIDKTRLQQLISQSQRSSKQQDGGTEQRGSGAKQQGGGTKQQGSGTKQNNNNQYGGNESSVRRVSDSHGREYTFDEKDLRDVTEGYLQDLKHESNQNNQSNNQDQKKHIQGSQNNQVFQSQQKNEEKSQGQKDKSNSDDNINKTSQADRLQQQAKEMAEQLASKLSVEFSRKLKSAGLGKGGVLRTINDNLNVNKGQLKQLLEMFIVNRVKNDSKISSWDKINRRTPYIVPGLRDYSKYKKAIVFFDVSGSMSDDDVDAILSSVKALIKNKLVSEINLNTFDDGLLDSFKIKNEKDVVKIKAGIYGGGGTYLSKALDVVLNKAHEVKFKNIKKGISRSSLHNERLRNGDIVMVFTDSNLFDDLQTLKSYLDKIKRITSNKILWFHTDTSLYSLTNIANVASENIIPVKVDFNRKEVNYFNLDRLQKTKSQTLKNFLLPKGR